MSVCAELNANVRHLTCSQFNLNMLMFSRYVYHNRHVTHVNLSVGHISKLVDIFQCNSLYLYYSNHIDICAILHINYCHCKMTGTFLLS